MSRGELGSAVRRWAPIAAALMGLGAWSARLESAVEEKAPATSVLEIKAQLDQIENKVNELNTRQTQFFCYNRPTYCR